MSRQALMDEAIAGDRRSLARAITLVELRDAAVSVAVQRARVRRREGPGAPRVLGVTGPPGAGKSTLTDLLVADAVKRGHRVAVVAVDPSSPFSGGAILGDRVRMERHTGNDAVFIRSLSSRGHLGGLSSATAEVVDLFDAVGFDVVIVETVGVGQSELGVMEVADTVLVVLTPESGDAVQTMKAGLIEIADLFVINKADRPGAERLARELARSLDLAVVEGWKAPVRTASAVAGEGLQAVLADLDAHGRWCAGEGLADWQRRRGDALVRLTLDLVAETARRAAAEALDGALEKALRERSISPRELAERLS